jgi:trigger factor
MTEEQVEADFAKYADDIKWQLIKDKLIKEHELKVSEEEIMEFAKKSALMQFQQYGMMNVPEEHLENYAQQILQNQDERRKIFDRKADDKIVTFLKATVKIEEKEVTTEEFNKFFE